MSAFDLFLPGADGLAGFALFCDRTFDRASLRDEDRTLRLKPIPQRRRREAIVPVISRDEGPLGRADQIRDRRAQARPGLLQAPCLLQGG